MVSPVDEFSKHALASWIRSGETLPASAATLARMISDLPASVALARAVTGLNYALVPADTGEFELTTPRGLIVRIRPARLELDRDSGVFEAVGSGVFRRPDSIFRGTYAMRFQYESSIDRSIVADDRGTSSIQSVGYFHVHIDVVNPVLRFFAFLVRGLVADRLDEEMRKMFIEARDVMAAAEVRMARDGSF